MLSIPELSNAQRLVERGMILNPLENPVVEIESGETRWFSQIGGWGSFGYYGLYGDDDHNWYQHLGAYAEIFRRGNVSSLALIGQIEFIADKRNDINFSPLAVFWEEGFLYTHRVKSSFFQLGYYHRCKHDIDNLRHYEERTLVYGSILARIIMPVSLLSDKDLLFAIQYDHYTITGDKRIYHNYQNRVNDWSELIHSIKINTHVHHKLFKSTSLFIDGYIMSTLLKNDYIINGSTRTEIGKVTIAGQVRFGIHFEYLGDSGITVIPRSAKLIGIGFRLLPKGSIQ